MRKITLLIFSVLITIGAYAQETTTLTLGPDQFANGTSTYTCHGSTTQGGWYGKMVTYTIPAVSIESTDNAANNIGWSNRQPWLKAGYTYNITVPEGYVITSYTLTTQSTSKDYSGTFTYTTADGTATSDAQVCDENKTVSAEGLSTNNIQLIINGNATSINYGILITQLAITYQIITQDTLSYTITDKAGNEYTGSYEGIPGTTLPSFSTFGYTLNNVSWNGNQLTAKIDFAYPVSKENGATNETLLAIFGNKYLHAIGNDIKAQTENSAAIDEYCLWAIYPEFNDGVFTFKIMNIATGKYIYSDKNAWAHDTQGTVVLSETPSYFTIDSDKDFKFTDKNLYLSINSINDSDVYLGTLNRTHGGTDITAKSLPQYNVKITDAKYATFYAPVAVSVPANVTAYYVTEDNVSANNIILTAIESGVIPANTAVILYSDVAGTYQFPVATTDADAILGNLLKGTVARTVVEEAAYVLSAPDEGVGLYKAELNENDGTAFVNNHHKAYLPASALSQGAALSAGLRFEFGTTGIENVESAVENAVYYDLSGRRVENPVKGIYIVNGKKVLVK